MINFSKRWSIALAIVISMASLPLTSCNNGNGDGPVPDDKTLVGISVTTPPTKIEYNIGETLDTTGMEVTATYSDGTTEAVTGYTSSDLDSSTAGYKTITVTYNGKTAEFSVKVINPDLETVATPTASPAAGTYPTEQNVTLTTTTPDAVIHYTTDGTTPTTASTVYSDPISISETTTVKAIAVKEDMNSSSLLEAAYIIGAVPEITTMSLPNGNVGIAYNQTLVATGDTPITWTLDSGTLPAGLTISSEGVISGTPTSEGTSDFTVKASNSVGNNTKSLSIDIIPHPGFENIDEFAAWLADLPPNTAASAYTVKLNVSSLGGSAGTPGSLGKTLTDNNDKYVSLDLSGSTITAIPDSAFYITFPIITGSAGLTGVKIPGSVTSIGDDAFRGCISLNPLIIPDSVISIGNYAFSGCSKLETVQIGKGVTGIGDGAFTYCSGLTAIIVHADNAYYTGDGIEGVLYNKDKTSLLVYPIGKDGDTFAIPASVTSIGNMAFYSNDKITNITISSAVTSIGEHAFQYCVPLISVKFERADTNFFDNSFEGGASLPTAYADGGIGTYKRSGDGSVVPYTWAIE
jgi:hypothetical protein